MDANGNLSIVVQLNQHESGAVPQAGVGQAGVDETNTKAAQHEIVAAARALADKKLPGVREVQARVGMIVVADFATDNEGIADRLRKLGCGELAKKMGDPALSSEVRTLWNKLQTQV